MNCCKGKPAQSAQKFKTGQSSTGRLFQRHKQTKLLKKIAKVVLGGKDVLKLFYGTKALAQSCTNMKMWVYSLRTQVKCQHRPTSPTLENGESRIPGTCWLAKLVKMVWTLSSVSLSPDDEDEEEDEEEKIIERDIWHQSRASHLTHLCTSEHTHTYMRTRNAFEITTSRNKWICFNRRVQVNPTKGRKNYRRQWITRDV